MSAGDLHVHKLDGRHNYDKALHDERFLLVLQRRFTVNMQYDIPYLGGYNKTGDTIYIDRDTPTTVEVGGKVYHLRPPALPTGSLPLSMWWQILGRRGFLLAGILTHETWEKTAEMVWDWKYDASHELAQHAEHRDVVSILHMVPNKYESIWRPVIKHCEQKLGKVSFPEGFDLAPYYKVSA